MADKNNYSIVNKNLKRKNNLEKKLYIYQLNCNGLNKILSEVKLYLYSKKPDLFCCCETFVNLREPKFFGYNPVWTHRHNKAKGGLLTLVRKDLRYNILNLTPFTNGILEFQSVRVYTDFGMIDVMNVYNPCKDVTYEEFVHYTKQLNKSFILIGDFNAHSHLWAKNKKRNITGDNITKMLDEDGVGILLCEDYTTYTDAKTGNSSCLDLCIATNNLYMCGEVTPGPDLGSDHLPIECSFEVNVIKDNCTKPQKWLIKGINWKVWSNEVEKGLEKSEMTYPNSTNDLNENLINVILGVSKKMIRQSH